MIFLKWYGGSRIALSKTNQVKKSFAQIILFPSIGVLVLARAGGIETPSFPSFYLSTSCWCALLSKFKRKPENKAANVLHVGLSPGAHNRVEKAGKWVWLSGYQKVYRIVAQSIFSSSVSFCNIPRFYSWWQCNQLKDWAWPCDWKTEFGHF